MHFCVEGNAKEKYVSIKINCNSLFRNYRYMLHEMTWLLKIILWFKKNFLSPLSYQPIFFNYRKFWSIWPQSFHFKHRPSISEEWTTLAVVGGSLPHYFVSRYIVFAFSLQFFFFLFELHTFFSVNLCKKYLTAWCFQCFKP